MYTNESQPFSLFNYCVFGWLLAGEQKRNDYSHRDIDKMNWNYLLSTEHWGKKSDSQRKKKNEFQDFRECELQIRWGINNATCDNIRFSLDVEWDILGIAYVEDEMPNEWNLVIARRIGNCKRLENPSLGLFNLRSVPSVTFR